MDLKAEKIDESSLRHLQQATYFSKFEDSLSKGDDSGVVMF